ncbi:MAG: fibronectin type III domain-containing protein [Clostridia bacterium]|nr:fibronectin type III domain-containing protein [Clostridia bacterium]
MKRVLSCILALVSVLNILIEMPIMSIEALAASADYPTDLNSMRARAEQIVNFEWIPQKNISTWNGNKTESGSTVFKKGSTVVGMPYTLFTSEVVDDSLLSLKQFKKKASSNYSATAECVSTSNNSRTGPVYGSCCATFVSEVFGGSLMSGDNPVEDSCKKLIKSAYTKTIRNATVGDIKEGDALVNTSEHHIIWVSEITSTSLVIYEQTPPIARKKTISKPSNSKTLTYEGGTYPTIVRPSELTDSQKPVISNAKGESHSEITISWGKVNEATKYKVERRKAGDDSYVVAKSSTTSTTFTDTGLEKGQRYYYKVTAYNGSTKLDTSESVGAYTKFSPPTVVAKSDSELKVSWDSIAKAENYTVMRRKSGTDEYEEIKTVSGTSYTDTGLSASTQYYYWIRANCVVDGEDIVAKSTTGGQYTLTKAPKISKADDISNSEITVTWSAVSGATSYRVERRKSGTENYSTIKSSTTSTSFADSGLETGERYYYRVYAKNSAGESAASEAVGVYTKFAAPSVKVVSSTQLQINWNAISKAESYTVKRRSYDENEYKDIKTVTSTSFTDSGLKSGTKYYYWIQANCNVDGTAITAKSMTGEQFTQLANPTVTVVSDTSIKVSWTTLKGHGTYKYIVQRKLSTETSYKNITTVTGTSLTDTGLKPNTTYNYRVQAVSTSGDVYSTSNAVSSKTSACVHSYGAWIVSKNATCSDTGSEYRVCSKCTNKETRTTSATGKHTYGNWTVSKAATCSVAGSEYRVCTGCTNKETRAIAATGKHTYGNWTVSKAATCSVAGSEYRVCTGCTNKETRAIAATGKHTYGNWTVSKAATCSVAGSECRVCTGCSNKETRAIPATGIHTYSVVAKVEATSQKDGYIEYKCNTCSSSYRDVIKYQAPSEPVKKVHSVTIENISLDYKDSTTITSKIVADAGAKYTVTYSSSNSSVASVDVNGKVTATGTGNATITCTVTDEYGNTVSDTCEVKVSYNWWQWIIVIVLFGWICY